MRVLVLPCAILLGLAIAVACQDGPVAPVADDVDTHELVNGPDGAVGVYAAVKKKAKKKGNVVRIDNNLPGGECPPTFDRFGAILGEGVDRNGDGVICRKTVGIVKKKKKVGK
jgi:hypothetical protein